MRSPRRFTRVWSMVLAMSDFEYIKWILDDAYLRVPPDHMTMVEDKGSEHPPQKVTLRAVGKSISNVALYRFDMEDGDLLPFFNGSHSAPKRLNAFCDYIALVEINDRLVVMLFELKRGTTDGHEDQLLASYEFMRYILRSAERIKDMNSMSDFKIQDMEFRRILLRRCVSRKVPTKPSDIKKADKQAIIKCDCHTSIRIDQFI